MAIMEKAQALAEEIVESTEYEELKNAETAMYDDEEAKDLLNEFESTQKRLQMAHANGKQINEKQQKDFQSIQSKMQQNEKIKEFMEAQQNFNKIMQTVNKVITDALQSENDNN